MLLTYHLFLLVKLIHLESTFQLITKVFANENFFSFNLSLVLL